MSIADFLSCSVGPVLGELMTPKEEEEKESSAAVSGFGNQVTCTIQGFPYALALEVSFHCNCAWAIAYVFIVKYNYTHDQMRILEPYFIAIPLLVGLGLTIPGIAHQVFNRAGEHCAIASVPLGCANQGSTVECTRGEYAAKYGHVVVSNSSP